MHINGVKGAYKVEAEDGGIHFGDDVVFERAGIKGQGEPQLPRLLSNVSREEAVDVNSEFSVKAVSGVQDKVGVCGTGSSCRFFDGSKESDDAISSFKASWGGGDVLRDVNVEVRQGGLGCGALGRSVCSSTSKIEDLSIRQPGDVCDRRGQRLGCGGSRGGGAI